MNRMKIALGLALAAIACHPLNALAESYSSSAPNTPKSPDWIMDAVIYQVYLRAFSPEGKFGSLENEIQRLKNLGVHCIELLPVQPLASSATDSMASPLDVKDLNAINLECGTKDGFKSLIDQAHFEEMKVLLDWVCDRVSAESPMIKAHPDWFLPAEAGGKTIPLDYRSRELRKFVQDSLLNWVNDYGLDGFHFLGAGALPADFAREIRAEISRHKPGFVLFADTAAFPASSFHAVEEDDFYRAVSSVTLAQVPVSRIETALVGAAKQTDVWPVPVRFIENFATPRAARLLGDGAITAAALLLTSDGVPLIYSGQEIAETRQPSLVNREPIDWAKGLKSHSETRKIYKKLIAFRGKHPALRKGQRFPVPVAASPQIFAFAASYREDLILAVFNFSPSEFNGRIDLPDIFISEKGKIQLKAFFDGRGELKQTGADSADLRLVPWGFQVWEMK